MGRKPIAEDEMKARLEFAKTHQPSEFAIEFGLSEGSARTYYSRLGVKSPRKPLFLDDEEAKKYAEEHTVQETAEQFGVSPSRLYTQMKERGIKHVSPWKKKTADRDDMIRHLASAFKIADIAKVFCMTKQRVSQIANKECTNDEPVQLSECKD